MPIMPSAPEIDLAQMLTRERRRIHLIGVAGKDLVLGPCRVVFINMANRIEESRAQRVVKIFGEKLLWI